MPPDATPDREPAHVTGQRRQVMTPTAFAGPRSNRHGVGIFPVGDVKCRAAFCRGRRTDRCQRRWKEHRREVPCHVVAAGTRRQTGNIPRLRNARCTLRVWTSRASGSDPRCTAHVRSIFVSVLLWRSWTDASRRSHGARLLRRHDRPPGNHQSMLYRSRSFMPTNRRSRGIGLSAGGAEPDGQPGPQRLVQIRKPSRAEVPGVICVSAVDDAAGTRSDRSVNRTVAARSRPVGHELEANSNGLASVCRIWINGTASACSTITGLLPVVGSGRSWEPGRARGARPPGATSWRPYYAIVP